MDNVASTQAPADPRAFVSGGGRLAELIAGFDWSVAALPAVEHWPTHMKTATALLLRSNVRIVLLWGPRGVMVYFPRCRLHVGHGDRAALGDIPGGLLQRSARSGFVQRADERKVEKTFCIRLGIASDAAHLRQTGAHHASGSLNCVHRCKALISAPSWALSTYCRRRMRTVGP